jgi:isocitrate dehydrogenase (NAD+)
VCREIAKEYAGRVEFEETIIDAMAMKLVLSPERFDVMVTTNLFGDILSDLIAGLVGGLGLAPGANIGANGAIFEAVHGTAPDIVGKNVANPGALLLAACLLLEHIGQQANADRIRAAMLAVVQEGTATTPDLGGSGTTDGFADAVIARLRP